MTRPLRLLALFALFPADAAATTLNWKTAVSGSATTASNWTPAQVPTSTDDVVFNLTGTYTVTWNGVPGTNSQIYRRGTVTWSSNTAHTIDSTFKVAELAGETAALSIVAGAITASRGFTLGQSSGTGSLTVTGPTAQITAPGTADILVGVGGTGSLTVINGGQVSVANFSQFGSSPSGTGNLTVSGVSLANVRSRFSSGLAAPGALTFGSTGHSTATIDDGAIVEATNRVAIAPGAGSVGSVLVQNEDEDFGNASELNVTGTLDVALALGAGAGGTGSLEVTNFGEVTVSGLTTVGDANGGTGTLRVRPNGTFSSGGLVFDNTHGVLDFTGGTIDVAGGLFDPPGTTLDLVGGSRRVRLRSGASASFTSSPFNAYALIVGETGNANFDLFSGSDLQTNATTALGIAPGAIGGMLLSGAGTTWTPAGGGVSQVVVGIGGSGTLLVDSGAQVTADILSAAYSPGSSSSIFVSGAGSRLEGTSIVLGGHETTAGGTANLTLSSGGALVGNGDANSLSVLAPGNLFVNSGSTVEVPGGEIHASGDVTLAGGTIDTPRFVLEGNGTLQGNGTLHGVFSATDPTTFLGPFGGVMEIGDSTVNLAFTMAGTFKVGSAEVRVRSRTGASLPFCTIEGGTLDLRPGGGSVPAGRTLSGHGTIRSRLVNSGTITASAPNGLTIADTLASSGQVLNGAKFTFAPGSRFQGFGTIDSDAVDAQAGSTIQPTGVLTIGKNAATTSVTLGGTLLANAIVTVNHRVSTAPCPLGTLTRLIGGGSLVRTNGFSLQAGDTLEGSGTIQGPVPSSGVVSPGIEPAANTRFATLNVNGNYTQNADGRLIVQIGDAPTNLFDRVAVSGVATLAGTLDIRLPAGFAPSPGEQFTVMTYASRAGAFSNITFQGYPPGSALTVAQTATSVIVTAGTIPVGVPEEPLPAVLAFGGTSGARDGAAFTLALPEKARVRIAVYGPTGRRVAVLCDREVPAGTTRFPLAPSGLNSGVWFARAEITTPRGLETRTARATLLR